MNYKHYFSPAGICTLLCASSFLFFSSSCKQQLTAEQDLSERPQVATVTFSFASDQTKLTTVTDQSEDNTIKSLDIFAFKMVDGQSQQEYKLESYKHYSSSELTDINALPFTTTTGKKRFCVIANAHELLFKGITTFSEFCDLTATLSKEELQNFTMYGQKDKDVAVIDAITISLERFLAKVEVKSIKTKFTGGPYEDMKLSGCKLYLLNAHGAKLIHNGAEPLSPVVLNEGQYKAEDVATTVQTGLIYDEISSEIGETGYTTPHYLYAYSNETEDISNCTKLLLEATLDGVKYYYPILINQTDYGFTSGVRGISRNKMYSYSIVISRPGSLEPNEPLVPGSLTVSLDVLPWEVLPTFDKEF